MGIATPMDREDHALGARLREWADRSGCRLVILFGSGTGSKPIVEGDLDLALDLPDLPSPERRLDLIGEIQEICGERQADIVFLGDATDPVLRFEIFRDGVPLYESAPGIFVDEKVRALMLYEDALPFRRLLRERLRGASRVT